MYERKLEEAEKAKEAWKEARKEARCVVHDAVCVSRRWAGGSDSVQSTPPPTLPPPPQEAAARGGADGQGLWRRGGGRGRGGGPGPRDCGGYGLWGLQVMIVGMCGWVCIIASRG